MSSSYQRIPCGVFDTSGNEKDAIVLYGWIVEGQLDTGRLEAAWWALAKRWPILLARLRQGWFFDIPGQDKVAALRAEEDGKAQDDKTRLFLIRDLRHTSVHDELKFHTGADLPQDRITVERADNNLSVWADNSATSVAQLMREDRAQISVQVTVFSDATTVCLSTAHVLCDGVGAKEMAEAWSKCINGREDEVKPLDHAGTDAFRVLEVPASEPPRPSGWRVLGWLGIVHFALYFVLDLFKRPPSKMENRYVFVPKQVVQQLKEQALACLGDGAWVSSSDVLAAWIVRSFHADKRDDPSPLSIIYPSNLRWLDLDNVMAPLPIPYLRNAAYTVSLPEMPASQFASRLSLGQVALLFRRTLEAQTQAEVIKRSLVWRTWSKGKTTVFFRPSSHWLVITNWRKLGMYDVDFGTGTGKVLRTWEYAFHPVPLRNSAGLIADDPTGGVWLGGYLSRKEWETNFGNSKHHV
ncbi:Transcriptional regulator sdnM [Colletotrichum sidae]|uniref:Transcriptional regulator sdnM n=1 Tax=Colletotrichum sidae TaxID=1347389 RepID=A0A4R8TNM5_9PEZI|nr:Transcriptional regulator sdnM [Colletotrichum sidae]